MSKSHLTSQAKGHMSHMKDLLLWLYKWTDKWDTEILLTRKKTQVKFIGKTLGLISNPIIS